MARQARCARGSCQPSSSDDERLQISPRQVRTRKPRHSLRYPRSQRRELAARMWTAKGKQTSPLRTDWSACDSARPPVRRTRGAARRHRKRADQAQGGCQGGKWNPVASCGSSDEGTSFESSTAAQLLFAGRLACLPTPRRVRTRKTDSVFEVGKPDPLRGPCREQPGRIRWPLTLLVSSVDA